MAFQKRGDQEERHNMPRELRVARDGAGAGLRERKDAGRVQEGRRCKKLGPDGEGPDKN